MALDDKITNLVDDVGVKGTRSVLDEAKGAGSLEIDQIGKSSTIISNEFPSG